MFKTSIQATPLTTDAANSFFQNITGDRFGNDNSFVSTLRALVAPRIKDGESICLFFGNSNFSSGQIGSVSATRAVEAICNGYSLNDISGKMIIHSFKSDTESNLANFDVLEKQFTSKYDGYHRLDKVREFYRKSFAVDCYINPDSRNVIVFVDNLDNKKLHYLQMSALAFLPWYFNPEDGISEVEMELIRSLRETTPEKYAECIDKIASQYDFKSARVRQLLSGFETRYERIECEKTRNEIANYDHEINMLNSKIGAALARRSDTCIKLLGLEQKIAGGGEDSEIMDYFLCNDRLYLEGVSERDMFFCVKDYLTYFDREMAERTISNPRSYVYNNGSGPVRGVTTEQMKKLMTEIFVNENPSLKIKFCAAYSFDLNGNVRPSGGHVFPYEFSDAMPNPHIDRYTCMGNYLKTINQLLLNRDYIGAIEQCIASCKSLNWGDSTVMNEFMNIMWGVSGHTNRCIELPNGNTVKPSEAIRWLEQQENNTNEQETEEA